jgi:hypothetical protein
MDREANRKAITVEDARPFALGPRPGLLDQALSGGWATFKRAWPLLLVASLVMIAGGIPGQVVSQGGQFLGNAIQRGGGNQGIVALIFGTTALAGLLLSVLVQWPAQVGAMTAALCAARGDSGNFGATLAGFRRLGTSLLVMLLVTLCGVVAVIPGFIPIVIGIVLAAMDGARGNIGPAAIIGFVLIGVGVLIALAGSLYVTSRTMLAPMRALDPVLPKVGAVEALSQTWAATRGNVLPLLGILLLVGVVMILGLLACCVGIVLFSMPLWLAWLAAAYRVLFDGTAGHAAAP